MNLVSEEVQTLVSHINSIMKRRQLTNTVYAIADYNIKDLGVTFNFIYKIREQSGKDNIIFNLEHTISIDEFIDKREFYIEAGNERLYDEILIHTSFEPNLENEELNKYKWN